MRLYDQKDKTCLSSLYRLVNLTILVNLTTFVSLTKLINLTTIAKIDCLVFSILQLMLSAICFASRLLLMSLRCSFCHALDRRSSLLFYFTQYVRSLSDKLAKIVLVCLKSFVSVAILISITSNKCLRYIILNNINLIKNDFIKVNTMQSFISRILNFILLA